MEERRRLAVGTGAVVVSMLLLFALPQDYFVAATFASTSCMMAAAFFAGGLRARRRPEARTIGYGLGSAALLYLVFVGGAWLVSALHPFGISSASETSIYSLISSPSNPLYLQVAVLLFDSAGYELFFRGVLQKKLTPRLGAMSVPCVALADAALHVATLNPLWVGATFITDLAWGLTYHYGKGGQASFTSHFAWDVAIFILRPVR